MTQHFEPNLKHQSEAIASTVRVFEGAPYTQPEERFWSGEVSSNILKLSPEALKKNIEEIAAEGDIEDYAPTDDRDFTIEMETGTGKTYVYPSWYETKLKDRQHRGYKGSKVSHRALQI
jgi:type III restriction enzyme